MPRKQNKSCFVRTCFVSTSVVFCLSIYLVEARSALQNEKAEAEEERTVRKRWAAMSGGDRFGSADDKLSAMFAHFRNPNWMESSLLLPMIMDRIFRKTLMMATKDGNFGFPHMDGEVIVEAGIPGRSLDIVMRGHMPRSKPTKSHNRKKKGKGSSKSNHPSKSHHPADDNTPKPHHIRMSHFILGPRPVWPMAPPFFSMSRKNSGSSKDDREGKMLTLTMSSSGMKEVGGNSRKTPFHTVAWHPLFPSQATAFRSDQHEGEKHGPVDIDRDPKMFFPKHQTPEEAQLYQGPRFHGKGSSSQHVGAKEANLNNENGGGAYHIFDNKENAYRPRSKNIRNHSSNLKGRPQLRNFRILNNNDGNVHVSEQPKVMMAKKLTGSFHIHDDKKMNNNHMGQTLENKEDISKFETQHLNIQAPKHPGIDSVRTAIQKERPHEEHSSTDLKVSEQNADASKEHLVSFSRPLTDTELQKSFRILHHDANMMNIGGLDHDAGAERIVDEHKDAHESSATDIVDVSDENIHEKDTTNLANDDEHAVAFVDLDDNNNELEEKKKDIVIGKHPALHKLAQTNIHNHVDEILGMDHPTHEHDNIDSSSQIGNKKHEDETFSHTDQDESGKDGPLGERNGHDNNVEGKDGTIEHTPKKSLTVAHVEKHSVDETDINGKINSHLPRPRQRSLLSLSSKSNHHEQVTKANIHSQQAKPTHEAGVSNPSHMAFGEMQQHHQQHKASPMQHHGDSKIHDKKNTSGDIPPGVGELDIQAVGYVLLGDSSKNKNRHHHDKGSPSSPHGKRGHTGGVGRERGSEERISDLANSHLASPADQANKQDPMPSHLGFGLWPLATKKDKTKHGEEQHRSASANSSKKLVDGNKKGKDGPHKSRIQTMKRFRHHLSKHVAKVFISIGVIFVVAATCTYFMLRQKPDTTLERVNSRTVLYHPNPRY